MFSCVFTPTPNPRGGLNDVEGLVGNIGHSVVKAVECNGKRFVVLRDPYGKSQWTGPWSDGSKQWTPEWLEKLPELGYSFAGPTGQFIMECEPHISLPLEFHSRVAP